LFNKIQSVVFAVGDDKNKKGKERKGKKRKGKVHEVTRRYISVICEEETPGPIPIEIYLTCCKCNRQCQRSFLYASLKSWLV